MTYQRNQLEDALRHITEGIDLFRRTAFHQPLGNGLATLAWIRQTYGDTAAAGKSNQRIAHQLVVTLDTVKSTSAKSWASSGPPTVPRQSPGDPQNGGVGVFAAQRRSASWARWAATCGLFRRMQGV